MRYVLAILALAISGVLLLLGIGQRTFLAPPTEIVYPVEVDTTTNYAVIDASELAKVQGQANIAVTGKAGFAAIAKTIDVEGWLAPFDHSRISVDLEKSATKTTVLRGEKPNNDILKVDEQGKAVPLDPRGNDLWLETRSADSGGFRMPVALTDSQSLIISGDGVDPLPAKVSIVWVQDRATPWAGPLLLAGALFALLGAALYLIAFDRDKRALGPRRGRRGPLLGVRNMVGGPRKRAKVEPSAVVDGDPKKGGLTSAAALPPGASASEATTEDAPEVATEEIVEDVSEDIIEVDAETDDIAEAEAEAEAESEAEIEVKDDAKVDGEEKKTEGKGDEDEK